MRSPVIATALALLSLACSAPIDERSTEDGSVAHPRCESCHLSDFEEADDPVHAGELPATCFVCHSQRAWAPAHLEHDFYPLTGAHLGARCFSCHITRRDENAPRFEGMDGDCVDCHRGDYDRSRFPGHSRFPLTCDECHSTSGWSPTLHPPPDAWVDVDAGLAGRGVPDGVGSASWDRRGWTTPDAGTHPTARRRRRPPATTTSPPETTVETPPPPTQVDIGTSASRRR